MRRSALLGSVLLSLCLTACGGEVAPEVEEPTAEMSQEIVYPPKLPACDLSKDWIYRYFSSSAMTTAVGSVTCSCGVKYSQGQTSSYGKLTTYAACVI
jgi:hypothetical protein